MFEISQLDCRACFFNYYTKPATRGRVFAVVMMAVEGMELYITEGLQEEVSQNWELKNKDNFTIRRGAVEECIQ